VLVPYGYFEIEKQLVQRLFYALAVSRCKHRGSDLRNALTYSDLEKFESVIKKAKKACITLRIPVAAHFRTLFICSPQGLFRDYMLSPFACYLITMNADSSYPAVAKAQVFLAMRHKQ
jgi:DNA-damage-inducible protein D